MGGLFGAGGSNASNPPAYTGLDVQTSAYGVVIPIGFGQNRLAGNITWYANFQATPKNSPSSGSGKGGSGGSGGKGGAQSGQYTYSADIILALAEGPGSLTGTVWKSQTETTLSAEGMGQIDGAIGQAPWSYLETNYPSQALGYSGIILVVGASLQLGTSAQLPNYNFEAEFPLRGTAPNGQDADASQVVGALLTSSQYGAGFPAARMGTLTQANEAHTVPASGPYTITVAEAAAFEFNLCVVDASGNLYTCVASNPGPGQYSFTGAGVYTFNAGDAGVAVTIRYAWLAGLTAYQNFTLAAGLWISPVYDQQTQASSMMDDLATYTYASFVWSSGVLTLVPRATLPVSGYGYSYSPPAAPLFDLTDDDFLPNTNATGTFNAGTNNDPVIVSRSRMADQINDITLEFVDRANQYATSIAEVTDQALLDRFGRRSSGSKTAHMFTTAPAANTSALYQLQDQYIRNAYSFTLDPRYCVLDPMDIVTLTDSYLGLDKQWVRITEITENDDGTLSISAEEYPTGTGAPPLYALNSGSGYVADYNVDPGDVNAPIVFGMPAALAQNQGLTIGAAISGSSSNWGGANVYVSSDGTTYSPAGQQNGPARMGVTTADFPVGSDPDTTDSLNVDLTQSLGQMLSGTQNDADQGNTLCIVGGANGLEFVSYETATLTAAHKYSLSTYLRRGQQGSSIVDHPSGAPFARMDSGIFEIPYTVDQIGKTIYLKFTSFNIYGGGEQSISNVTAYPITVPAPPPPSNVTGFAAQQNGNVVAFAWDAVTDFALKGYDIGYAPAGTSDWSQFRLLTEATAGTEMTNAEVPPGNWTFGIRARDIADQWSPGITTVDVQVTSVNPIIYSTPENPAWTGTLSGLVLHYTGVLVPENLYTPQHYGDGTDNGYTDFDNFVNDPVASCTYTTDAIDTGIDDTLRVFDSETMALGPGNTGTVPTPSLSIDTWLTGGTDPGTFTPWTVGYLKMRYLRERLTYAPVAGNVAYLSAFTPEVDKAPESEIGDSVTIAAGGNVVTFPSAFHFPPLVNITVVGSSALYATASNVSGTQMTVHVWDATGTDVGGTINYTAFGE